MLSLAAAQVREDGALERQIYQGLQDAGATLSRLHQRCEMVELCFQLLFLRGLACKSPTDGERAASPWSLELKRRQACLDAVSAECESRLMDFVLRNPHVSEEMEAAKPKERSRLEMVTFANLVSAAHDLRMRLNRAAYKPDFFP